MLDEDLKQLTKVIREVVKEEIDPISKQVSSLDNKVSGLDNKVSKIGVEAKSLNEQVANLTEKVEGEMIPTLKKHTEYFKRIVESQEKNTDNIERLDKRLSETEGRLGIQPPPEVHLIK